MVSVPVLSNATSVTFSACSRASPFRTRTPSSAPRPTPTVTAVGVASPSAQGQATTRTEIRVVSAKSRVAPRRKYQTTNAEMAIASTTGMNQATARSAIR